MRQIKYSLLLLSFFLISGICPSYAQVPKTEQDSATLVASGALFLSQVNDINLSPDSNIYLLNQAISCFQKSQNIDSLVFSYNNLSVFHYFNNDFDEAERIAQQAKKLAEEKLGTNSLFYVDALFNLTAYLDLKGFHKEAIEEYYKIIESDKKLNTPKLEVATTYQNLARAYIEIGDYEEAIEVLENALRIRQDIIKTSKINSRTNRADTGGAYSELADCYKRKNNFPEAKKFFKESLNVLSSFDEKSEYVNQVRYDCYYKLAEIYLEENQKGLAYDHIYKAVEIEKENNVFDDCFSYLILGKLNLADGKKKQAFLYYNTAIEKAINEAGSFISFPKIAAMYQEKGEAHLQLSEYDQALLAFQKGLQTTTLDFDNKTLGEVPSLDQIFQKFGALDIIRGKGKTFLAQYKSQENKLSELSLAYDHYRLAAQLIQVIRQGYNTDESKHVLAKKANQIYEEAIEVCDLLFLETKRIAYHEQAFIFAESNKAITLLESIHEETALNRSELPDSLVELERTLSIKLNFEEKLLAVEKAKKSEADETLIQKIKAKRFKLKTEYKKLTDQFEKNYPQYYQLKYSGATATVQQVQKEVLNQETALVEYFVGERFIYNFFISRDHFKVEKIKRTSTFEAQINNLRQVLSVPPESKSFVNDFKNFTRNAFDFYEMMLQKQLEDTTDDIKEIIIIPDDIIGFVPFDILLTQLPETERINYTSGFLSYLMEQYFISYSYSGTLLLNEQKNPDGKTGLGFIGFAPSFNDQKVIVNRACSDSELYSLKCSSEEVNTINQIFNGKIITEKKSTKSAFLEQVSDYNIVHLATHACVNEENAMLNQIHFADDYITMYDLYNLKLNADLVVLSACNTGSGKIIKGEGVMSLSRGFIQSGSASTLMSLWSVDDCATSDIMTAFYAELAKGQSKNIALQKAKLNYINTASDKAKAHPYYWAAFVPFGDTSPLILANSGFHWPILGFIVLGFLVFLGFFFIKKRKINT